MHGATIHIVSIARPAPRIRAARREMGCGLVAAPTAGPTRKGQSRTVRAARRKAGRQARRASAQPAPPGRGCFARENRAMSARPSAKAEQCGAVEQEIRNLTQNAEGPRRKGTEKSEGNRERKNEKENGERKNEKRNRKSNEKREPRKSAENKRKRKRRRRKRRTARQRSPSPPPHTHSDPVCPTIPHESRRARAPGARAPCRSCPDFSSRSAQGRARPCKKATENPKTRSNSE